MPKRKKRKATYHGYKSKKQWRWAFASGQTWAREKAHRTAGGRKVRYRRLPESKHSGRKGGPGALGAGYWSKSKSGGKKRRRSRKR